MKRKTKLKLINSTLVLSISTATITPIAFILNSNSSNFLLNKLESKSVTKDKYDIDGNTLKATLPLTISDSPSLYSYTAVPGGFVFWDKNARKIICIDENNLSKILWYAESWDNETRDILAIDYSPINDALIIFFKEDNPNSNDVKEDYLKIGRYINISNVKDGTNISSSWKTIEILQFSNATKYDVRTWSMTPVIKKSGTTSEFILFPGYSEVNYGNAPIFIYDVVNDTCRRVNLVNAFREEIENYRKAIVSMSVYQTSDNLYHLIMLLNCTDRNNWGQKDGGSFWVQQHSIFNSSNGTFKNGGSQLILINNSKWTSCFSNYEYEKTISYIKSSIRTGGIYCLGREYYISFAINAFAPANMQNDSDYNKMPLYSTYYCYDDTSTGDYFSNICPFFVNDYVPNLNYSARLFQGYFDNDWAVKNGAIEHKGPSFLGVGMKDANEEGVGVEGDGRFVFYINETGWNIDTGNYKLNVDKNLDALYLRAYLFKNDNNISTNESDNFYYAKPTTKEALYNPNLEGGIALKRYNDDIVNGTREWENNILYVNADIDANQAIVINQFDRGQKIINPASYGWTFKPELDEVTLDYRDDEDIKNKVTIKVDVAWLMNKFELSEPISDIATNSFLNKLNFGNNKLINTDITFLIKDVEIKDNSAGIIEFKLFANKWIDGTGKLKDDTEPIATVSILGFLPQGATAIKNSTIVANIDVVPYQWSDENINQFIWDNKKEIFDNLPEDLSMANITFENRVNDNINGTIKISVKIDKYFDEQGQIQNGVFGPHEITITDFKNQLPTIIENNSINISINQTALDWSNTENINDFIFENINKIFTNLPEGFTKDNVNATIEQIVNNKGQLIVNVIINKYVDQNGILIDGIDFEPHLITINGFITQGSTLLIKNDIEVDESFKNKKPSEFTLADVNNIINKLNVNQIFKNAPKDAYISVSQILESSDAGNTYLKVKISISKYYDENGDLVDQEKSFLINIVWPPTIKQENNSSKNNTKSIIAAILIIIGGISLLIFSGYLIYKYLKQKDGVDDINHSQNH